MINGFAAILVGVYLALVAYQGNAGTFFSTVAQDFKGAGQIPGFFKWFIALVVLYALTKNEKFAPITVPLFYAALIGLGLNVVANRTLLDNIKKAWNSF